VYVGLSAVQHIVGQFADVAQSGAVILMLSVRVIFSGAASHARSDARHIGSENFDVGGRSP